MVLEGLNNIRNSGGNKVFIIVVIGIGKIYLFVFDVF